MGERRIGAYALFEVLRAWGVRRVFCCPGTTEVAFLDAALDNPDVELVLTTHESIAVAMADGHARATGRPAVAYLHTNVGLANGLAHLHCARLARSPVVVLAGLKRTGVLNRKGFTSDPHVMDLPRPFCKSVRQAMRPADLVDDLHRTLQHATAPPAGPAFLALPQDVLEAPCPGEVPPAVEPVRARPDPDAVARATGLLAGARRPILVAGDEIARAGAVGALVELAERLGAPAYATARHDLERAAFPTGHPLYCGRYGPEPAAAADLVMVAGHGSFQDFDPPAEPRIPPGVPFVHLTEEAGELGRYHPTAVALAGDAGLGLADLLAALPAGGPDRSGFLAERRAAHAATLAAYDGGPVPEIMRVLARHVDSRTTVVSDCVTAQTALLDLVPRTGPDSLYSTEGGSLGWGVGAALGVALARPDRRVIAVLGDGVFQFGTQGLWTAVRYGVPAVLVIVNNRSYEAVRGGLARYGGRARETGTYPLTDIGGPDYAAIARGFGAAAVQVDGPAALEPALAGALAERAPAVIEVPAPVRGC